MTGVDERVFRWLLRLYPREFRDRYGRDLMDFFREDRGHAKYGAGPLRPLRFWAATLRDLVRTAMSRRRLARAQVVRSSGAWTTRMWQDLRFAWRGLWMTPGVTVSALAVLILGIGAGTSVFSVVDGVVLRGLPFSESGRLVSVAEMAISTGRPFTVAPQNYLQWVAEQDAFQGMGAVAGMPPFNTRDEPPEGLRAVAVTDSLFDVLRVVPALGRAINARDERQGAAPVAVISDRLWHRRFHGASSVLGQTISTKTTSYRVVGVMPPGFSYPTASITLGPVDVWVPFAWTDAMSVRGESRNYLLSVVARLKPTVTLEMASARMAAIRDRMATAYPTWFTGTGVLVRNLQDAIVGASVRSWMLLLLGAVMVVLLMACVNAASLLMARAVARAPELAIRTALGATGGDLARSLLAESLLLSIAGAAGGMLVALWGVDILRASLPASVPRLATVALDARVMTIAGLTAIATSVLFGTIPALQASRPDVITLLGQGGRSHSGGRTGRRFRTGLVIAEVAMAVVLLAGSALFLTSFSRVISIDLGFDPRGVVSLLGSVIDTSQLKPPATADELARAQSGQSRLADVLAHVRAVPGVVAASAMLGGAPLSGGWMTVEFEVPGGQGSTGEPGFHTLGEAAARSDEPSIRSTDADYLRVMRGTLVRGRWISASDVLGSLPVIVMDDEAERRYFHGADALGERVRLDGYERTVVGIVRAMRFLGPEPEIQPEGFVPLGQTSADSAEIVVRTSGNAATVAAALQAAVRAAMPSVATVRTEYLEKSYAGLVEQRRFNMMILTLFGLVAVAIAAVGIYGLMAFIVAQRRREIGVHVALGAMTSRILSMVLGRAIRLMVAGLAPGLVAALLLEKTARAFLFEPKPHDPVLYGGVAALLLVVGVLAAWGPARRATRVDPLTALRLD